jgi:predicted MFS family arabinose efflux permease
VPSNGKSSLQEIKDGLSYIRSNPVVLRLMILAFSVIFNAVLVPIIPVYARDRFDVGETGFAVMLAAWAVGQGISALWITLKKNSERKSPAIMFSTVMFIVSSVTFALSTNYVLSLFALALLGAGIPIWASAVITLIQTQTDRKMIGRVMSVFALSLQSMMFGWFLGAWIGTIIGNAQMMIAGTIIYAIVNFGIIFTSKDLCRL